MLPELAEFAITGKILTDMLLPASFTDPDLLRKIVGAHLRMLFKKKLSGVRYNTTINPKPQ